jgi:oxygen-independent coproporphyrinogen-3 oxidase
MAYQDHIVNLQKLRQKVPDLNDQHSGYIADVTRRTDSEFDAWNWAELEAEGFHKKGDYCFIYSYPPVRALSPITQSELFRKSPFGSLDGPINLYIHIPYCTGICSYCYFAKVADTDKAPVHRSDYPEFLRRELDLLLSQSGGRPVIQSVHFGGGTPSTLNEGELKHILSSIGQMDMVDGAEITLECAPETLLADPDKVRMMMDAGINRFNLGVESLDDEVLRIMGRRHVSKETMLAMEMMFKAGVGNLNVDVIYDLPGQNLASWIDTLHRLERAGVHSLSTYRLRKHPRKAISKLRGDLYPEYAEGLKMQIAHGIVMHDAGFIRSSSHKYARSADKLQKQVEMKRSVGTNQLLSLGCGAYGFINSTFYWNTKSLSQYRDSINAGRLPVWIGEVLSAEEEQRKSMVLGMHTNPGVRIDGFMEKFGLSPRDVFGEAIARLERLGLLEQQDNHIRPTEKGRFFSDEISLCFYSQSVKSILEKAGMRYGMFFEADKYV